MHQKHCFDNPSEQGSALIPKSIWLHIIHAQTCISILMDITFAVDLIQIDVYSVPADIKKYPILHRINLNHEINSKFSILNYEEIHLRNCFDVDTPCKNISSSTNQSKF